MTDDEGPLQAPNPCKMPLWLVPTLYVVASVLAAELIPRLEYAYFPQYGDNISVSTAQALLGATSSGMMALTAIVFSIAFLLIQYTAVTSSKRFVLLVARRPVIFHAFGLFVATFTFSLGTLEFVNRGGSQWVPFISILIVGALMVASIALLARLIHQVADLRVTRMLAVVGDIGRETISRMSDSGGVASSPEARLDSPAQVVVHRDSLKVLRKIDAGGLSALARDADATIRLEIAVGDTVYSDSVLARVYNAARPIPESALLKCLLLAPENLFDTDPRFALRLLVDTAIMALSPAVNDPTTAVEALDQIQDLMRRLGTRRLDTGRVADESGKLRLLYPVPSWEDYLSLAFDEIRRYGGDSVQVVRRLRAVLVALAGAIYDDPTRRDAVAEYRRRLDVETERAFADSDDLETALGVDPQGLGLTR